MILVNFLKYFAAVVTLISFSGACFADDAKRNYLKHCAGCHGKDMSGGSASSLVDGEWQFGDSPAEIAEVIKHGLVKDGMPGWSGALSDQDIRDLVELIQSVEKSGNVVVLDATNMSDLTNKQSHSFDLQKLANFNDTPWSIAFMPDKSMLITERNGKLWKFSGERLIAIKNTPEVWDYGQGGLLDIQLHPQFDSNGWIYLAMSEGSLVKGGMTKILRGKIIDGAWSDEQLIYSVDEQYYTNRRVHFGSRMVLSDGYIYFSVGDRGHREEAQDLSQPNGKIHRLYDDGRVPAGNPFVDKRSALDSIWSYGHRNPQGLVLDQNTGLLWETEHGPRGGDELNVIEKGKNYGWPTITYGINYNGTPITSETHREGMEQPKHYWTPSIAASGIDVYYGSIFPAWQGKLFASGMATETLHLITLDGKEVVSDEVLFENKGRVRDVAVSPEGEVFVLLNSRGDGALYKLTPL